MPPRESLRRVAHDRITSCPVLQEAAAVLRQNPDATDCEIADAVNQWWQKQQSIPIEVSPQQIAQVRQELGIAPTWRRPFQKQLFAP